MKGLHFFVLLLKVNTFKTLLCSSTHLHQDKNAIAALNISFRGIIFIVCAWSIYTSFTPNINASFISFIHRISFNCSQVSWRYGLTFLEGGENARLFIKNPSYDGQWKGCMLRFFYFHSFCQLQTKFNEGIVIKLALTLSYRTCFPWARLVIERKKFDNKHTLKLSTHHFFPPPSYLEMECLSVSRVSNIFFHPLLLPFFYYFSALVSSRKILGNSFDPQSLYRK